MKQRFLVTCCLVILLAGCQTGSKDTEGALESAVAENASGAGSDDEQAGAKSTPAEGDLTAADTSVSEVTADNKRPDKPATKKSNATSNGAIVKGVEKIARIRNTKGERGAVESIFSCYKKARTPDASIELAKVCAAIDFSVSREVLANRPKTATGTGDRALVISKRHAERIGALLQFKGMGQSQFNTFGKFLHAVAEPAYKKARTS